MNNSPIPPITSELGRQWTQPDHNEFLFDETYVLMERTSFCRLAHYSGTFPSGVYDGKMWKRFELELGWLLVWYGNNAGPGRSSIEFRQILIVEDGS
jgi:hypothetical protein